MEKLRFEPRAQNFNPRIDYVLMNEKREVLFEAICHKWSVLTSGLHDFEFVNHLDGTRKMIKVSHPFRVNPLAPTEDMYTAHALTCMEFDGIAHWEYLKQHGIRVSCRLKGARLQCELFDGGNKVAQSVNDTTLFGKVPMPNKYTIEAYDEYIEAAFMVCFISAHVDWIDND